MKKMIAPKKKYRFAYGIEGDKDYLNSGHDEKDGDRKLNDIGLVIKTTGRE